MSKQLIRALLRLATAPPGKKVAADTTKPFENASQQDWSAALTTLELHRVESLAWHGLHTQGLTKAVPEDVKNRLQLAHRNALLKNGAHLHAVGEALRALGGAGITPVLWKGVVLAGCFYPKISMRSMDDIDMTIAEAEREAAGAAFKSIGYEVAMTQTEAVYYRNAAGIVFDVHHRVQLFEGHDRDSITTTARSPYLPDTELRILSPEALIAHLTVHANGHRGTMGYVLRWIVDLHFVLNQVSDRIAIDRLRTLIPSPKMFVLFLRFLGFLETELGVATPESLRKLSDGVSPLSLEETLRSRRLAMWGLPGPRGLARLALGRNVTPAGERRPRPHASDLVLWPWDGVREALANASGRRRLNLP
ncbi:MAG: nucleotidyltransferase family protein [Candidatus Hydrogenedentes bacterium]|nr:nucleotidyltransferase family protein [Candidatus Hydrogenedentota bacterium]